MLDPSGRTRLVKRMLYEPLATLFSYTTTKEHINAVLREMLFNTELFEYLFLLILLVFKMFVMPRKGTLNIELGSVNSQ